MPASIDNNIEDNDPCDCSNILIVDDSSFNIYTLNLILSIFVQVKCDSVSRFKYNNKY